MLPIHKKMLWNCTRRSLGGTGGEEGENRPFFLSCWHGDPRNLTAAAMFLRTREERLSTKEDSIQRNGSQGESKGASESLGILDKIRLLQLEMGIVAASTQRSRTERVRTRVSLFPGQVVDKHKETSEEHRHR
jgi:hypothetical protein